MHIHGGGWVLGDEIGYFIHQTGSFLLILQLTGMVPYSQDALLKYYADTANLVSISVGYRLAPEHPFPAGPEDCYDAVEWLVDNAEKEFGAPLKFISGEVSIFLNSYGSTFY